MTREELIERICPADHVNECGDVECNFCCKDCNDRLSCMLAEYEKQFRDKIIADTIDLFLDALKTYDKYGYMDNNYLLKLSKENEKYYVPYIHIDDVIKCANGTVKMLKGNRYD